MSHPDQDVESPSSNNEEEHDQPCCCIKATESKNDVYIYVRKCTCDKYKNKEIIYHSSPDCCYKEKKRSEGKKIVYIITLVCYCNGEPFSPTRWVTIQKRQQTKVQQHDQDERNQTIDYVRFNFGIEPNSVVSLTFALIV